MMITQILIKRKLIAVILLLSLASLICFGIIGIGRSGKPFNFDGSVLFDAGRAWLGTANPYNHDQLTRSVAGVKGVPDPAELVFAYPPQAAAICIPLALLSYSLAKNALLLLNLLSIAAIVIMTVYEINRQTKGNQGKLVSWLMPAIIIGNPFTTDVVWMGQTSLIAFVATMAAWLFSQQKKFILAGIFLGIASFKPQICILLIIWFLLNLNWKILLVTLATAGAMSIYPMFVQGPIGMIKAWHQGLQYGYEHLSFNTLGDPHVVSLESFFYNAGLTVTGLKILGIILVIILWSFRNKINSNDILGMLMALTFTFVGYSHDYDYVALVPVITSLSLYCQRQKKLWLGVMPLFFLLIVPQRLVRSFRIPVLEHWRTIVVLILLITLIALSIRYRRKQRLLEIASSINKATRATAHLSS